MPLVLDTFNVLHTVGILPPELAGLDVPGLAALILRSRHANEKTTFVCDGLPAADLPPTGPLASPGDFTVRYAGRTSTADDLIRTIVEASTAPRRLIVVSSDHAIQKHAQRRRCPVLSSQDFLQQLADDANLPRGPHASPRAIPPAMSAEQVDKWIDVFDLDDDDMIDLPSAAPLPQISQMQTPDLTKEDPDRASQQETADPLALTADELRELENIDMNALLPPDDRSRRASRQDSPRRKPPSK